MFEEYLEVAYEKQTRKQATFEVVGLLEGLPDWEVEKIAEGMPVSALYGHLDHRAPGTPGVKVAFSELTYGDSNLTFLDAFKGTPLFDQAIALEQEEIQAAMLDQQKKQERRAMNQGDDQLWNARDKIRLRKRLLELELAKSQNGSGTGAPVPGVPDQGSGAPGPVPAEGVQDSSSGLGGGVAKMGAAVKRAFAVTEKGHKFDAEKHRIQARQGAELAQHSQSYGGLPHHGSKSSLLDRLRFGTLDDNGQRPDMNARHHEYAAKKHEAGSNAWNPLGGMLTPSSHEVGATTGLLGAIGKSVPKYAEAEENAKMGAAVKRADEFDGQGLHPGLVSAYRNYGAKQTKGTNLREGLSTVGGAAVGAGAGGALGYGAGALAKGLGVKADPKSLAMIGAGVLGALGMGVGAAAGGSHGNADVELGKAHERVLKAEDKYAAEKLAFADKMGRMLARAEFAKHAGLGAMIGKSLNGGGLGQVALKAMKHPGAAGAIAGGVLGAAGGAIAGGPDNRLGGALGGAALGAGAGHVAGGIGSHMLGGKGLGDAAKAYGGGMLQKAKALGGEGAGPKA